MKEAAAYRQHSMAQSFHPWTPTGRIETSLDKPLYNAPTGYSYSVVEEGKRLYQVENIIAPDGKRVHELRRRMDFVMGSGHMARSYFTEENGRLFQLPLTWYRQRGWDFSPGYQNNNGRFDRVLPDRCISCHSSYPRPIANLEGKFAELRSGIGCERCHGPGALHVKERGASVKPDGAYDNTIVNPARLPLQRRVDTCEQCHVHTSVSVLRENKDAFSYIASQLVSDQWAFFRVSGSIDIVSHADRLRQSKCFLATQATARPLECATCHKLHEPPPDQRALNAPCASCHVNALLQKSLARSASLSAHGPASNCVSCHMPKLQEGAVHSEFTEHWIRVAPPGAERAAPRAYKDGPIEPYYDRDKTGPDAKIYQGMGQIVYANLSNDSHTLGDAIAALDSALGADTTRAGARFLLGVANQQLGITNEAIRALEVSVRADSNRPEPLRALAQAYLRTGRPLADIYRLYQRALAVQPAIAWIRAEYGDVLEWDGRSKDAEAEYRRALKEQPSLANTWFALGATLAEQGRRKEMSDAFREAVHLDPRLGEALSPLLEIRTSGNVVTAAREAPAALPASSLLDRRPGAVRLRIATDAEGTAVHFLAVPAQGVVEILQPDGTLLRSLAAGAGGSVRWDLLIDSGQLIAGGLYRVRVRGRDASSGRLASRLTWLGVVRFRER